jgi:multiple sugar transport system substrate-binding protein
MRHLNRRSTTALAVAVSTSMLVAGCGGDGGGGGGTSSAEAAAAAVDVTPEELEGTTIELSRVFGECGDDVGDSTDLAQAVGECETITTLTNQFNAENEFGITVERLGGAKWDTYYDALNAAFASDSPPDVAIMHTSSLPDYAERGLLVPVDELAAATGVDLTDAVPSAQEGIAYDGVNYAVPYDVHGILAHVNLDLFAQAGLVDASGAPVMPTSPEELLAAAEKVRAATGKDFLAVARVEDGLGVRVVQSLMGQQGKAVVSEDGKTSDLDSPEALEALGVVNALVDGGYTDGNQTYDAAQESFLSGDVALLVNGTWVVDQYTDEATFGYAAVDFPTLFEQPASWADNHTWALPVQPDADPVQYRAAMEYIAFLYEHDAEWALGTGHIAGRTSAIESADYQAAPQRAGYAATGLTNAQPVPHIQGWPAVDDALQENIESVWFEDADPAEALKKADAAIESQLGG